MSIFKKNNTYAEIKKQKSNFSVFGFGPKKDWFIVLVILVILLIALVVKSYYLNQSILGIRNGEFKITDQSKKIVDMDLVNQRISEFESRTASQI